MHIGVDATCWTLPRGFGRHTRCLLSAIRTADPRNEYTFFTDSPAGAAAMGRIARVTLVPASMPIGAWDPRRRRRRVGDMLAMSRALANPSFDVVLFPTVYSYVPVVSRARKVMLFHDVTAERLPQLTLDGWPARMFWSAKIALARRQAHVVVTVSQYSRRALAREFALDPARVRVVGEAADSVFRRLQSPAPTARLASLGLAGTARTIVYVGGFSPHKNLPMLLDAFGRLAADPQFADVTLALVGDHERDTFVSCYREVRARIDELGLGKRVIVTGFMPDEDLAVLLNRAAVLALPSMMEGFGLPAIEAARCGCAVIATTESPLPEILGERGGVFVNPRRPEELDRALRLLVGSAEAREAVGAAGLEAASRLSWETAARDLVAVIEEAAAS